MPTDTTPSYEQQHVHDVYEQIAPHFSSTRYKAWPIVARFLTALPAGTIGIDSGCGNGKYLRVRSDIFILASDRSAGLLAFARGIEPHDALVADALCLPHREASVDFAISIAVVHHLASRERRVGAVRALLEVLREGGRCLIFVWALEQRGSRRGWDEGGEQDVMVPWVMKGEGEEKTFHRYYHLYRKGELEEDVLAAGGEVIEADYERDNWYAIARRKAATS